MLTVGANERNSRVAATANAPSGIAQLRKSSEHAPPLPPSDPMNLDDFIHNDNIGTPAGLALTPTPETMRQSDENPAHTAAAAAAAAIPIKARREPAQHLVPQSVPVAAHQRVQSEFGYLPRHPPRKTSIDETGQRVSLRPLLCRGRRLRSRVSGRFVFPSSFLSPHDGRLILLAFTRPGNDPPISPLMFPLSPAAMRQMGWTPTRSSTSTRSTTYTRRAP